MSELPHERLFGDYGDWPGRDVLDSGGDRLGGVREIYLDRETGRPEWVLVDVEDDQPRFVPLADASVESSAIRVAHSASAVRGAPAIGPETHIDNDQERELYAHYGIDYSDERSDSGLPADVTIPPDRATEVEEDVPPEDTASAEAAAAGAGPTAVDDAAAEAEPPEEDAALWSEVDEPALPAPAGAAPGAQTPGLPPSGPPEPPQPVEAPRAPAPPPPPPPAAEGSARRPVMAGAAAVLAVLLFLLVRRLRS